MEKFCKNLKEHARKIINYEKKEMIPLSFREFINFRGATHSIGNLLYKTPKEIPVVFHKGSTYDYHI